MVRSALCSDECDALREHVLLSTDEAAKLGRNDLFGNIQEADRRYDLKLDLCPPVVEALNSFASHCGPVLRKVMGGTARVVELAAITSDGGAVAQPVHADTMHGVTRFLQSDLQLPEAEPRGADDSEDEGADEDVGALVRAVATDTALIFTSLLALQDITPEMGPTHVWPGTNTVQHHATLWGTNVAGKLHVAEADKAFGVEHRKMTLSKGDLVLYDSRTMHCGGANTSDGRRSVFCVSCMGPGIRPDGTTWTMLPSLRNRLRMDDFPLSPEWVRGPAAGPGAVELPLLQAKSADGSTKDGPARAGGTAEGEPRPVPPLEEWAACVQCSFCGRWRPCAADEAPKLMGSDSGFHCAKVGFACCQEQRYTAEEIDAALG